MEELRIRFGTQSQTGIGNHFPEVGQFPTRCHELFDLPDPWFDSGVAGFGGQSDDFVEGKLLSSNGAGVEAVANLIRFVLPFTTWSSRHYATGDQAQGTGSHKKFSSVNLMGHASLGAKWLMKHVF